MTPQLHGKRLQLLKIMVPSSIVSPSSPIPSPAACPRPSSTRPRSRSGSTCASWRSIEPEEFEATFDAAVRWRAQAVMVLPDALLQQSAANDRARRGAHALPEIYWAREFADEGALLAYGGNRPTRFAARPPTSTRSLRGAEARASSQSSRPPIRLRHQPEDRRPRLGSERAARPLDSRRLGSSSERGGRGP